MEEQGYFNPRSREGSDQIPVLDVEMMNYFNPRSREGSDFLCAFVRHFVVISIHAPVKGATRGVYLKIEKRQISIHAPVKGAT